MHWFSRRRSQTASGPVVPATWLSLRRCSPRHRRRRPGGAQLRPDRRRCERLHRQGGVAAARPGSRPHRPGCHCGVARARLRQDRRRPIALDAQCTYRPPPVAASKGAAQAEHQGETPWQSLVARLVEVVLEVGLGRSRGGFTGKLHLSADGHCRRVSRSSCRRRDLRRSPSSPQRRRTTPSPDRRSAPEGAGPLSSGPRRERIGGMPIWGIGWATQPTPDCSGRTSEAILDSDRPDSPSRSPCEGRHAAGS